jgi:hypothetical protein
MYSVNPRFVGTGIQRELNTVWRTMLPYCGSFYDTTTQGNGSTTAVQKVSLNSTEVSVGISVVSSTKITFKYAGIYDVAFSAQLDKSSASAADVDLWIAVNGVDVPWSNTRITLQGSSAKVVAAWDWVVHVEAGDFVEIEWFSSNADVRIATFTGLTSPSRPSVPSVIVTVLPLVGHRPVG